MSGEADTPMVPSRADVMIDLLRQPSRFRDVELRCTFRALGVRWPLRPGDGMEIWINGTLIGEVSGATVRFLVEHHLLGALLETRLRNDLSAPPAPTDPHAAAARCLPGLTIRDLAAPPEIEAPSPEQRRTWAARRRLRRSS